MALHQRSCIQANKKARIFISHIKGDNLHT